jgi:predicted acylesterase/phospholipase RssA
LGEGQIKYFYSREDGLTLDHIVASGSLPPSFPMTVIDGKSYWDGGLFDNTPLGAVLDRLDNTAGVERTIYVVNLFPNKAPIPGDLQEVLARMTNLQFANKTLQDVKLLHRINKVAKLMQALETLPQGNPLKDDPAYQEVKKEGYIYMPRIIPITPPETADEPSAGDFSPEAIQKRADAGYAQTIKALGAMAQTPG